MTDIVERLRSAHLSTGAGALMHEAAAEIARLRTLQLDPTSYETSIRERDAEIERLRAALQSIIDYPHCGPMILRATARRALEPKP